MAPSTALTNNLASFGMAVTLAHFFGYPHDIMQTSWKTMEERENRKSYRESIGKDGLSSVSEGEEAGRMSEDNSLG